MKARLEPEAKPKPAKFHVLSEEGDAEVFEHLSAQRVFHPELEQANIKLCWLLNVKSDPDGHLVLGKAIKAPPLWQQVAGIDWFIGINRQWWQSADTPQRSFLIDHELCHMAQKVDKKTGEQVIDDHGFLQWRTVKHDIGEFFAPVQRHGLRLGDLLRFHRITTEAQKRLPFTATGAEVEITDDLRRAVENLRPEEGAVTISTGGKSVTLNADGTNESEGFRK